MTLSVLAAVAADAPPPATEQPQHELKGRLTDFKAMANMGRYAGTPIIHHLAEITQPLEERFAEIARGEVLTYAKLAELPEAERRVYMKALDLWQAMNEFIRSREEAQYGREQREFTGAPTYRDFLIRDNRIRPKIREIYEGLAKEEDRRLSSEGGLYAVTKTDTKGRLTNYWNKVDRNQLPAWLKSNLASFKQETEEAFEEIINERVPTVDQLRGMGTTKQKGYHNAGQIFGILLEYARKRDKEKGYNAFGRAERELTGCHDFRRLEQKAIRISAQLQAIMQEGERINKL